MKKMLFPVCILLVSTVYSQSPIDVISKTYFRTHPFNTKFSSFVKSLQKDPWFTIQEYYLRTDTSFFFLTGTYKNFNPFRYLPKELRLVVAEEEIIHADSLKTHDTVINLQIMGITDTGIANAKAVEREFRRFHNQQSNLFSSSTHQILEDRGELYNYFIFQYAVSPVTIAWGALENNQYTFTITIRFKLKENMATFILAPGEF